MTGSGSDLLRLLHSTENSFVERETAGDQKDWVKTIVAFANSLNDNQEGVLFIGATNSGEIERSPSNLDKLQMTLSEKMQSAYPAIYYTTHYQGRQGMLGSDHTWKHRKTPLCRTAASLLSYMIIHGTSRTADHRYAERFCS